MKNESSIFISYSWSNKELVDEIDNDFKGIGITLIRDVRDAPYYESLQGFMKRIRDCDYVILVISDEYLKSVNCLYEVLEFSKEKQYENRILPILLDSAKKIRTMDGQIEYIKYWQEKLAKAQEGLAGIDLLNALHIGEEIKKIRSICQSIGEFISVVGDKKTLDSKDLKTTNYKAMLDFVGIENPTAMEELLRITEIQDIEEQDVAMDEYEKKFGESDKYYYARAYVGNNGGRYKLSKYYYEKALEFNPNLTDAHNNLGNLLVKEPYKDFDSARNHFERVLELNPNDEIAHNNLATLLRIVPNKDYSEARKHYEKALQINPNYVDTHCNLANLLKEEPYYDYDGARKHYEIALELNPKDAAAHNHLANLLNEEPFKEYDIARKHYEIALELNPNYAEAHNNLANLLKDEPYYDYDGARKHYEIALELNPKYTNAHYNIALLLINEPFKDFDNTKQHYEEVLKLDPEYVEAHNNLANLIAKQPYNDFTGARAHLEKALELSPNNAEIHCNLANLLVNEPYKDYDGAKKHYKKALELNPNLQNQV